MKITVAEIKSLSGFGINLSNGRVLYLLSKISVYADSGNSVSYCFFTILKNKTKKEADDFVDAIQKESSNHDEYTAF